MTERCILYASPFIPPEWIAAHGFRPQRVVPSTHANAFLGGANEGLCPFARAFVDEAAVGENAAAVVIATTCDQMRRCAEPLAEKLTPRNAPVFSFNVPVTWQSETALRIYAEELQRLGRFLVRLGGKAPAEEHLQATLRKYDAARTALRARRESMAPRAFAEAILTLEHDDAGMCATGGLSAAYGAPASASPDKSDHVVAPALAESALKGAQAASGTRPEQTGPCQARHVRVALIGGPLLRDFFELYDIIEAAGARVVLDATETGERTLPAPFNSAALEQDPQAELTRAYFGHIPDVFRRPNDLLYAWLTRELPARGVQGALLLRCLWCDLWHAELPRLKEALGVPIVELDPVGTEALGPRSRARIEALLEMLR